MRRLFFIIIVVFLFSGGVLYGTICANYSPCAYEGVCTNNSGQASVKSGGLNTLVVIGAGYFLESHSSFQSFLNKVELSELYGVDFNELNSTLEAAILSMENARYIYYALKTTAASTPYNQAVIENLKAFDYDGFIYGSNLNPLVFKNVREYLAIGDVTGAYNQIYLNKSLLLEKLLSLKSFVSQGSLPPIKELWDLNQSYSNALLFGQYIAMIFSSIL
jgi:hypothetical protein